MNLSELRGELIAIRSFVSSIYEKENKAFWAVGVFATLMTLIAFGFNAINTSKFDDAIERSERRVEVLAGILRPKSASIHGIRGEGDGSILMDATIFPDSTEDFKFFTIIIKGSVLVKVSGGNGRLLGYSARSEGPIADFQARYLNGRLSEAIQLGSKFGTSNTEGEENGRMISETAPLQVFVNIRSEYLTCYEASGSDLRTSWPR